jgi:hypothetical protein
METLKKNREGDLIVPGGKRGKPLSNMSMLAVLGEWVGASATGRRSGRLPPEAAWGTPSPTRSRPPIGGATYSASAAS